MCTINHQTNFDCEHKFACLCTYIWHFFKKKLEGMKIKQVTVKSCASVTMKRIILFRTCFEHFETYTNIPNRLKSRFNSKFSTLINQTKIRSLLQWFLLEIAHYSTVTRNYRVKKCCRVDREGKKTWKKIENNNWHNCASKFVIGHRDTNAHRIHSVPLNFPSKWNPKCKLISINPFIVK